MPDIRVFTTKGDEQKQANIDTIRESLTHVDGTDNLLMMHFDEDGKLVMTCVGMSAAEVTLACESAKLQVMLEY